jgi:hypothetical protein
MYTFVSLLLCCIVAPLYPSQSSIISKNITDCLRSGTFGAISGAVSAAVYAPFHYAQNQAAQGFKIELKNMHHCYRGYGILATNNIPVIALQTVVYKIINNSTHSLYDGTNLNVRTTFAAIFAGIAGAPLTNASQLLTVHKQNTGLPLRTIINTFPHSYKSLSRGLLPNTLQGILFVTAYTNGISCIKNAIHHYCDNNSIALISSACLSSILLTITTQPLRVMATKLHADIEYKQYKGLVDVIKKTIQHHGFKGSYTGSLYRTAGNILALPVINSTQQVLNNIKI